MKHTLTVLSILMLGLLAARHGAVVNQTLLSGPSKPQAGVSASRPVRNGMVHVNYGSYTLAIRDGDWKLILLS